MNLHNLQYVIYWKSSLFVTELRIPVERLNCSISFRPVCCLSILLPVGCPHVLLHVFPAFTANIPVHILCISASSSLVSQSSSCLSVFSLAFKRSASNEVVKLHNWPAAHGRINTHCMHGGHSIYGYNSIPLSLGYVCPLT